MQSKIQSLISKTGSLFQALGWGLAKASEKKIGGRLRRRGAAGEPVRLKIDQSEGIAAPAKPEEGR